MRLYCRCAGMRCWLGSVCSWGHIRPLPDVEASPHREMNYDVLLCRDCLTTAYYPEKLAMVL